MNTSDFLVQISHISLKIEGNVILSSIWTWKKTIEFRSLVKLVKF
jgi:hypothetical protein